MSAITIRPESHQDGGAIHRLTAQAFAEVDHSDGSEPAIVDRLRADGDLTLSLVAEDGEAIVGHIAFSPVSISDGSEQWFGLGPVSVDPVHQGCGIGSRLIQEGLAQLRQRGAGGVVLLGDPAYYARFGFQHDPQLRYPGPPAEYFQRLVLDGTSPTGEVQYAPAFG